LKWIEAGEEVSITRRGVIIARLVPEVRRSSESVDWEQSAALRRNRRGERTLTEEESRRLFRANKFLSFDVNQRRLARAEGLQVGP
jgi:antitoxin (DNA-binding transcriptional repressor) of toxin-antitoxin stability system